MPTDSGTSGTIGGTSAGSAVSYFLSAIVDEVVDAATQAQASAQCPAADLRDARMRMFRAAISLSPTGLPPAARTTLATDDRALEQLLDAIDSSANEPDPLAAIAQKLLAIAGGATLPLARPTTQQQQQQQQMPRQTLRREGPQKPPTTSESLVQQTEQQQQKQQHRMADGLQRPAALGDLIDFCPEGYHPGIPLRQALADLADRHGVTSPESVQAILDDFAAAEQAPKNTQHEASGGSNGQQLREGLTEEDRLALFVYCGQLRDPGSFRRRLLALGPDDEGGDSDGAATATASADALFGVVEAAAQQMESVGRSRTEAALSPEGIAALQAASVTVEAFLRSDLGDEHWLGLGLSRADCLARRAIAEFAASPDADDYTEFQLYREMNRVMREPQLHPRWLAAYRPVIFYISRALHKLPPHRSVAYRGVSCGIDPTLYTTGSTILWPSFSSTSLDVAVGKQFLSSSSSGDGEATKGGVGTLFVIETCRGRSVELLSPFPTERELLLPPNACLRVKGLAGDGVRRMLGVPSGVQVIELVELDDATAWSETVAGEATRLGDLGNARYVELFRSVADRYPNTCMAHYAEAYLRSERDRDRAGARALLCRALAKDRNSVRALALMGWVFQQLQDLESAWLFYQFALQVSPMDNGCLLNLNVLYAVRGDTGPALVRHLRAYSESEVLEAVRERRRGRELDRQALSRALVANPLNPEAYALLLEALNPPAPVPDPWDLAKAAAKEFLPETSKAVLLGARVWDLDAKWCRFDADGGGEADEA